jgi:hypothetical protein
VQFNGTSAGSFNVSSDTQVTATVPAGATTGPISVTTPSGTGTSTASFTLTNADVGKVVISQIFGGGGNLGSAYKNDFIELYNSGNATVDLTGWAVQYASASGTTWAVTPLKNSIAPSHYYLIQEAAGPYYVPLLPTPDVTNNTSMHANTAKVALTSSIAQLMGSNPSAGPTVVDFVGYGTNANAWFGSGYAPTISNTVAVLRLNGGVTDTRDNAKDFYADVPNPRNSSIVRPPAVSLKFLSYLGGDFEFCTTGDTNVVFAADFSTNLSIWTPLLTNKTPFSFIDSAGSDKARFYRARSVP